MRIMRRTKEKASNKMKRIDLLLVTAAQAQDMGLRPIQLQKTVFLVGQELTERWYEPTDEFYRFEPKAYGPFSQEIHDDAASLEDQGMVRTVPRKVGNYNELLITLAGDRRARELASALPETLIKWIREMVDWAQVTTIPNLVGAVCRRYPQYGVNSIFREENAR